MNVYRGIWAGTLALLLGAWSCNWWGLGPQPPWRDLLRDPIPTDRAPCYVRYELSCLPNRALVVWLDLSAAPAGTVLDDDQRTLRFVCPPVRLHIADQTGRTVKHYRVDSDPRETGSVLVPLGTFQPDPADTYLLTLEIRRPIRHWAGAHPQLRIQTSYTAAEMERAAFTTEVCQPVAGALAMALAGIGLIGLFSPKPATTPGRPRPGTRPTPALGPDHAREPCDATPASAVVSQAN